jgi:hypothetical protein
MIKLINILKEITEGKQVGTLYHYTGWPSVYSIIKENTLKPLFKGKQAGYVSLTRSKNQDFTIAQEADSVIVLDGDKLSNNYKITPYHDVLYNNDVIADTGIQDTPIDRFQRDFFEDEKEERIKGPITNLNKYLLKVIINVDNKNKDDLIPKLGMLNLNQLIDLLKEKNIPYEIKNTKTLYPNRVQKGSAYLNKGDNFQFAQLLILCSILDWS